MLLMGKPALHHFIMTTNNWSVVCVVEISFAFNHILGLMSWIVVACTTNVIKTRVDLG